MVQILQKLLHILNKDQKRKVAGPSASDLYSKYEAAFVKSEPS